jgi:PAS domain S-box-containing protein
MNLPSARHPPALPDWSTLFDLLPVGAYRSTVDGRMLRSNAALVRLNGYASEAEHVAAVNDIAREWYVDPLRRAAFRAALETVGRVQGFVSEIYRHRTRERIWINENAHVVRDAAGNILCYEGTVEEITDRVRTLQALEESQAQLRLIAQQLPGVVYLAHVAEDGSPDFRFISEGVRSLYGVTPDDVMRDGRLLKAMRHPDDSVRVQSGLDAQRADGDAHVDEFRIVRRDGSVRWVQGTSSVVHRTAFGDIRTGLIVDITERREADELRSERDRAQSARRATVGLLSRISHELRTPLNAVLGFAQLLERDPSLGERQHRFAAESLRAGGHLLALVDDVLDLGRMESGEFALRIGPVDPATALQSSVNLVESLAQEAGLTVSLPDAPLPMVLADPQRLRQILTNLLSNAIKYNRPGGWVRVTVTLDAAVDAAADDSVEGAAARRVRLAVEDGGIGLDAAQQARLFRPFDRLGAERGPVAGTGLGLSLSQQMARAMHGDIEVASQPGTGSSFTLVLPAA